MPVLPRDFAARLWDRHRQRHFPRLGSWDAVHLISTPAWPLFHLSTSNLTTSHAVTYQRPSLVSSLFFLPFCFAFFALHLLLLTTITILLYLPSPRLNRSVLYSNIFIIDFTLSPPISHRFPTARFHTLLASFATLSSILQISSSPVHRNCPRHGPCRERREPAIRAIPYRYPYQLFDGFG